MITRRNWLLRCSILINIAVLLYICSHVMIGNGNIALGPTYIVQEDYSKLQQQQQQTKQIRPQVVLQGIDNNGDSEHMQLVSDFHFFMKQKLFKTYLLIVSKK